MGFFLCPFPGVNSEPALISIDTLVLYHITPNNFGRFDILPNYALSTWLFLFMLFVSCYGRPMFIASVSVCCRYRALQRMLRLVLLQVHTSFLVHYAFINSKMPA